MGQELQLRQTLMRFTDNKCCSFCLLQGEITLVKVLEIEEPCTHGQRALNPHHFVVSLLIVQSPGGYETLRSIYMRKYIWEAAEPENCEIEII